MKVCSCSSQRQNKSILSFLAPPHQPASAKAMLDNNPGKSAAVGLLLFPPRLQTLFPSPTKCLRLCSARLGQAGLRPALKQMAPDRMAACQSWICFPLLQSCVYGICAFVLRCFFSVLTLYSPMEHSLGVNFFFFLLSFLM